MNILGIFAKEPVPGRVKTRLARDLGAERAAEIYSCFVETVLARTSGVADQRIVAFDRITEHGWKQFQDGQQRDLVFWEQPAGDLGERLKAFVFHWQQPVAGKVVLMGTDSPSLPILAVQEAFHELDGHDVVIGPSFDGGYYLIGMSGPHIDLFTKIDWGSSRVLEQTLRRVQSLRLNLHVLQPWYDIDTVNDLQFLASHLQVLAAGPGLDEHLGRLQCAIQNLYQEKTSGV